MNGVFDLGGTDGLGPVVTEDDEPVFRAEWEKIAFSLFASCFRAGLFNIDSFRHGIEQMDPAEYLLSNYYEHWAHVAEHSGEKAGVIDPAELDRLTQFYLDNPDAPCRSGRTPSCSRSSTPPSPAGHRPPGNRTRSRCSRSVTPSPSPPTARRATPAGPATSVAAPV